MGFSHILLLFSLIYALSALPVPGNGRPPVPKFRSVKSVKHELTNEDIERMIGATNLEAVYDWGNELGHVITQQTKKQLLETLSSDPAMAQHISLDDTLSYLHASGVNILPAEIPQIILAVHELPIGEEKDKTEAALAGILVAGILDGSTEDDPSTVIPSPKPITVPPPKPNTIPPPKPITIPPYYQRYAKFRKEVLDQLESILDSTFALSGSFRAKNLGAAAHLLLGKIQAHEWEKLSTGEQKAYFKTLATEFMKTIGDDVDELAKLRVYYRFHRFIEKLSEVVQEQLATSLQGSLIGAQAKSRMVSKLAQEVMSNTLNGKIRSEHDAEQVVDSFIRQMN